MGETPNARRPGIGLDAMQAAFVLKRLLWDSLGVIGGNWRSSMVANIQILAIRDCGFCASCLQNSKSFFFGARRPSLVVRWPIKSWGTHGHYLPNDLPQHPTGALTPCRSPPFLVPAPFAFWANTEIIAGRHQWPVGETDTWTRKSCPSSLSSFPGPLHSLSVDHRQSAYPFTQTSLLVFVRLPVCCNCSVERLSRVFCLLSLPLLVSFSFLE